MRLLRALLSTNIVYSLKLTHVCAGLKPALGEANVGLALVGDASKIVSANLEDG